VTEYIVKITVTTALVVLISEIGKRSSVAGALLASLPIVSILAMLWLYSDTRDATQVAVLRQSDIFNLTCRKCRQEIFYLLWSSQ
jgi:hypothetical protein